MTLTNHLPSVIDDQSTDGFDRETFLTWCRDNGLRIVITGSDSCYSATFAAPFKDCTGMTGYRGFTREEAIDSLGCANMGGYYTRARGWGFCDQSYRFPMWKKTP